MELCKGRHKQRPFCPGRKHWQSFAHILEVKNTLNGNNPQKLYRRFLYSPRAIASGFPLIHVEHRAWGNPKTGNLSRANASSHCYCGKELMRLPCLLSPLIHDTMLFLQHASYRSIIRRSAGGRDTTGPVWNSYAPTSGATPLDLGFPSWSVVTSLTVTPASIA